MNTSVILTKETPVAEIKSYFEGILKLSESDEQFPVDLDHVWQLAYSEKGKAVRALKENFFENEDFILFAQNGKQTGRGGYNKKDYRLSVSCLEYFVARKVRPVFEVYRKVFHKAINEAKKLTPIQALSEAVQHLEQVEQRQIAMETRQTVSETRLDRLEARMKDDPGYYAITGYANLHDIKVTEAQARQYGKAATKLSAELGVAVGKVRHSRFGLVGAYHETILQRVMKGGAIA